MTNQVNNDVIKPIEYDHEMDRFYIPVNSRYEIQTKGKGSSFRIANTYTQLRSIVVNDSLHPVLEDMAKATNAEMGQLQATNKASEIEINSLKERVAELSELLKDRQSDLDFEFNRAEQNELDCNALTEDNLIMRDTLNKIALGNVYDADIIESAGDCLQRLSNSQSLAKHDNDVIERIALALENAEGEFKYLPEYVALVRAMKVSEVGG